MDEAKPRACDTWQGLRAWGCGDAFVQGLLVLRCVFCGCSGSGLECPAVDGESPVRETLMRAIGVLPE